MPDSLDSYFEWRGNDVVDGEGELIGRLERLYLDRESDRPKWAQIAPGAFGGSSMLAPLEGAVVDGDRLQLSFDKQAVWDAPGPDSPGKPQASLEARLHAHYGLAPDDTEPPAEPPPGDGGVSPAAPVDVVDQVTVTRSEEEIDIGVARRPRERVRVIKQIVTEDVTRTIPVRREELRLVHEAVDASEPLPAVADDFTPGEPYFVTLMEEEVVIEKRIVPRERVRVYKETITEERHVSEDLRKEQVEVVEGVSPPS